MNMADIPAVKDLTVFFILIYTHIMGRQLFNPLRGRPPLSTLSLGIQKGLCSTLQKDVLILNLPSVLNCDPYSGQFLVENWFSAFIAKN